MEKYVAAKWNMVAAPKIFMNEKGVFVFRFQSEDDVRTVP